MPFLRLYTVLENNTEHGSLKEGEEMEEKPAKQELKINFPENLRGGAYSNAMRISHTKEEFVLDFIMLSPPLGAVTARVITSPGHIKRMISVLQENLTKYESNFGKVAEASEPPRTLGFHPQPTQE
jgi:hypothetical protein